jgi:predicted  nucleic acid-binding Zn-ribbon protein
MFQCQECGRKFRTSKAAQKAANNGCPGCGGVDIHMERSNTKVEVCRPGPAYGEGGETSPRPTEIRIVGLPGTSGPTEFYPGDLVRVRGGNDTYRVIDGTNRTVSVALANGQVLGILYVQHLELIDRPGGKQ